MKPIAIAIVLSALATCVASGGLPASMQARLGDNLINVARLPSTWGGKVEGRRDSKVKGGALVRIKTTGKETDLWAVGAYSDITKPVKKGDRLVLAFWARLEKGGDGADTATLPYNAVQLAHPPRTPVLQGAVTITPAWQLHQISGVADQDYAVGTLTASSYLATGEQTVDFGPIYVLDMGQ